MAVRAWRWYNMSKNSKIVCGWNKSVSSCINISDFMVLDAFVFGQLQFLYFCDRYSKSPLCI